MAAEEMEKGSEEEQSVVPRGQLIFDNLLWLFILSLLISLVIYNAWGLFELSQLPFLSP